MEFTDPANTNFGKAPGKFSYTNSTPSYLMDFHLETGGIRIATVENSRMLKLHDILSSIHLQGQATDTLTDGDFSRSLSRTRIGTSGNESLFDYEGNDWIDGRAGDDTIDGGAGDDFLIGGDGNDLIYGGSGNNFLIGGTGADCFELVGSSTNTIADLKTSEGDYICLDGALNITDWNQIRLTDSIYTNGKIDLFVHDPLIASLVDPLGVVVEAHVSGVTSRQTLRDWRKTFMGTPNNDEMFFANGGIDICTSGAGQDTIYVADSSYLDRGLRDYVAIDDFAAGDILNIANWTGQNVSLGSTTITVDGMSGAGIYSGGDLVALLKDIDPLSVNQQNHQFSI